MYKHTISTLSVLVLAVIVGVYGYSAYQARSAPFPLGSCGHVATNTTRSIGPSGPQGYSVPWVVATNTSRAWVEISNNSALTVWLNLNFATAGGDYGVGKGIPLFASSTKRFDLDNLWTGSISAVTQGSVNGSPTSTLSIVDCNAI